MNKTQLDAIFLAAMKNLTKPMTGKGLYADMLPHVRQNVPRASPAKQAERVRLLHILHPSSKTVGKTLPADEVVDISSESNSDNSTDSEFSSDDSDQSSNEEAGDLGDSDVIDSDDA